MNKEFEQRRKILSMVLIVVGVIIIIVMAINILGNKTKINNIANAKTPETTNYTTITDGSKVNTSETLAADKKIGQILIGKSAIIYDKGTSKLTSKVTNDSTAKENLRFTVKFIANDGSTIAESVGFVGAIKENEVKYIDSYITADVSNAKDIVYEIMQ